nr:class B sortase [Maliibacterium massiliense]
MPKEKKPAPRHARQTRRPRRAQEDNPYSYDVPPHERYETRADVWQADEPERDTQVHDDLVDELFVPGVAGPPTCGAKGPRRKMGRGRLALLTLSILIFIGSATALIAILGTRAAARDEYAKLAEAVRPSASAAQAGAAPDAPAKETPPIDAVGIAQLQQLNGDFVGWLQVPGTNINYPIVQGADNDYYLKHTFQKSNYACGAIFMDYVNAPDFSDANTVVYGHNMRDGSMLHDLTKMLDMNYAAAHDIFTITTPDAVTHAYRIFSVHQVAATDDYRTPGFANDAEKAAFFERMRRRSAFQSDVALDAQSRIVTFSTCPNNNDAMRIAVHGVYVGEKTYE